MSFMVGVSSSPPGSHWLGRIWKRLICSARDNLVLPARTASRMVARSLSFSANVAGGEPATIPVVAAATSGSRTMSGLDGGAGGLDVADELPLGDCDPVAGIAEQVVDLLR